MEKQKGYVSENRVKEVKFNLNKYPYAEKIKVYLDLKGIRITTFEKTLQAHGVSVETVKTFLSARHIPNSYLTHLIEDIWGIRFKHTDFEVGE